MRREHQLAIGCCLVLSVLGCGSDKPVGTTVIAPAGAGASGGASGAAPTQQSLPPGEDGLATDDPGEPGGCTGAACTADAGLVVSLCGNGERDEGEQCDDGNTTIGDGCNGVCNLEPNFDCTQVGQACTSTIVCGDGVKGGNERCDDGGTAAGDGCSEACVVEGGFGCAEDDAGTSLCTATPEPRCGDGFVNANEQCDDGDAVPDDGCSDTCQLEERFVCPRAGEDCTLVEFCGDGFLRDGVEECDDGNLSPLDGCDGSCLLVDNFRCPVPGEPCVSTVVCGDGAKTGNELCDDANAESGDGCSSNCRGEPGFRCPEGAGPCVPVVEETCGDGRLAAVEFCDDNNIVGADGCSPTCTIEPGFDCSPDPSIGCFRLGRCGDGLVDTAAGEQCDDGEVDGQPQGGDGCSATCRREALFDCPAPGGPCVSLVECGDGDVNGTETCDDRNIVTGDGCDDCQVEPGFICPVGGVCRALCGDGVVAGREQCDDGALQAGDGCGPDCRLEEGFNCEDPAGAGAEPEDPDLCEPTTCGQFGREGTEQCDDGNGLPYDGCFECRNEPCRNAGAGFQCAAVCGDGMKFPIEDCDDGNTLAGDGCSDACVLEPGFECEDVVADLGASIALPVVFRDFDGAPAIGQPGRHPHFQINPVIDRRLPGIVLDTLGASGKPVYDLAYAIGDGAGGAPRAWSMDGPSNGSSNGTATLDAATIGELFAQWYTDVPGTNFTFVQDLILDEQLDGSFQFSDTSFFPLNGLGFGDFQGGNNFHFTSEVRQAFVFDPAAPAPVLTFRGDDDVWVFVNGVLTVDLGGIHSQLSGRIVIDGASSQLCVADAPFVDVVDFDANPAAFCQTVNVPLDPLDVNEIAVFQAERNVTQSNYTLTLRGFAAPITACESVCGDGVVTADEACDLGFDAGEPLGANNTGEYETCNPDCTLTARCGDGEVDAADGEQCDNGLNTSTRLVVAGDCAPDCVLPPSCGDGAIDGQFEECDDGTENEAPGTYDACGTDCQRGPFCGDGVQQIAQGEQCDDGQSNGSGSRCLADCTLRCGNGAVDQGEQCDLGLLENDGSYEGCNPDCTLAPRCGDAFVDGDAGEACDDGLNDGGYGRCGPGCQPGPFCGDDTVQAEFGELCDEGEANSASAYGPGLCTNVCLPGPFCGDEEVDFPNGERCDDGTNSGQPGSCATDCSAPIPLPSCGDGNVDANEECDDGAANGTLGNACDARCQFACGNGIREQNEQCDDGVNSGAYGTCDADCTFAAFCGDGALATPPEACDRGADNVPLAEAYGDGVCTATCGLAPRCGDGRVDTSFGEACDGGPVCTNACNLIR